MDEISFEGCCRIILSDWRYRREGVDSSLRAYKQHLLALLNQEFAIEWHDENDPDRRRRWDLASMMPEGYARLEGPFSGLLEYTFAPGEQQVWTRHREAVAAAESRLKELWVCQFRDLLLLRWPHAAERTTSWAKLRELGLGEPVDELDFL